MIREQIHRVSPIPNGACCVTAGRTQRKDAELPALIHPPIVSHISTGLLQMQDFPPNVPKHCATVTFINYFTNFALRFAQNFRTSD